MYKIRSVATTAAVALGMLFSASNLSAQSTVVKTKGLMIGGHLGGAAIKFGEIKENKNDPSIGSDDNESGGGGGLVVGWGINKWLMIYGGVDVASIKIKGLEDFDDDTPFNVVPGDYTLVHGDLGVRFSFPGANRSLVPYANLAVSMRDASVEVLGEEFSLRGPGVTVGGGLQYFFNPKLALDANVQFTAGKFSEAEALGVKIDLDKYSEVENSNSARINVGIRFYPHFGSK